MEKIVYVIKLMWEESTISRIILLVLFAIIILVVLYFFLWIKAKIHHEENVNSFLLHMKYKRKSNRFDKEALSVKYNVNDILYQHEMAYGFHRQEIAIINKMTQYQMEQQAKNNPAPSLAHVDISNISIKDISSLGRLSGEYISNKGLSYSLNLDYDVEVGKTKGFSNSDNSRLIQNINIGDKISCSGLLYIHEGEYSNHVFIRYYRAWEE